jgi:uncharacterized cofD-like protein
MTSAKNDRKSGMHESIVLVGGGGGVFRIARYLKNNRDNITTIQTMFDHGGHSGELRDEHGVLPPGDIRQAILALADEKIAHELRALLAYRFKRSNGASLDGATVGNIILTALADITGSMPAAIDVLCTWFRVKGKVLPVSLADAELCVRLSDGTILKGEGKIDTRPIGDARSVSDAYLEPMANIYTEAYKALVSADKIVFCPGDLYTSILPNTMVAGFKEAIAETNAQLILVVNIMTKKAETHNYPASMFAEKILGKIGREKFDVVIVNDGAIEPEILLRYELEMSFPVKFDREKLKTLAESVVPVNVADQSGRIIRHHEKTASIIANI